MTVTLREDKGSALTYGEMDANFQHLVPTGAIFHFAAATAPSGYLVCDGSAVSRETYADLYTICGDTYGAGDGSTTFNLPNLIDKFIISNASSVGTSQAETPGSVTIPTTDWSTSGGAPGTLTSGRLVVGSGANEIGETLESIRNAGADRTFDVTGSLPPRILLLPCVKF